MMSAEGPKRRELFRWWEWALIALAVISIPAGPGALIFLMPVLPRIILLIRKHRYFNSEEFQEKKAEIRAFVAEHNELKEYIDEIRARGSFSLGESSTGQHAHLAYSENTSRHNYIRDRNVATLGAPNVHNCSLQVVRKAQMDPIRYLMKYFHINAEEDRLAEVEEMGSSLAQLEEALSNLQNREASITEAIQPPSFIQKHFLDEFMEQVGVAISPITIPYETYTFEYVSAGGNSSERTNVVLNSQALDALIDTMSARIKFRKSAAGQRALMTSKLRHHIKVRDNFTCQNCGVSTYAEPHLLLEVDHIIPVSRGGLTTEENLRALCWKCNRSKSNKI